MPARDQSGPVGEGPMTGRAAGICSGAEDNQPGDNRPFFRQHRFWRFGANRRAGGRSFGRGFGRGFGFQTAAPVNTQDHLKRRKDILEQELKAIKNQLKDE
jgi:hypothetical protein